jgi:pseudouridine synthase
VSGRSGGGPSGERLQKVLARTGLASRRAVEEMIREGRITVNGKVAVLGQRVDLAADAVKVDGRRVAGGAGERRYLLLNKPSGCVSTSSDPEGRPTVLDLLPPRLRKGVFPVGRLDFDTEGLIILTDDGELAQQVAHPRHGCRKVYEVKVKGRPQDAEIARLKDGVVIDGRRAVPLAVTPRGAPRGPRDSVSNSWWTVTLGQGRTRQIREMFFRIGHPVSRLRRIAIGPLADPRLPRGAWRELTEDEVARLREVASRPAAKSKAKPRPGRGARKPAPAAGRPGGRPTGKGRKPAPGKGPRRGR